MALYEKHLEVKPSQIPNAGNGLFTNVFIPKGENIVEYKGRITTWKEVSEQDNNNLYIMHVTDKHVIDASKNKKAFARYANDANGLTKIKGLKNNGIYVHDDENRVFIEAKRDIQAGEEILVGYGSDYWKTIRENMKIDKAGKKTTDKKRAEKS